MSGFIPITDLAAVPLRSAGGDNTVPRDGQDRPRIWVDCTSCHNAGTVASPKTGKPIKCTRCRGEGRVLRSFTRTTTYIDVLEDKSNLAAWAERMVLIGVALDPDLLKDVGLHEARLNSPKSTDEEQRESKDWLNRRAKIAKEKAGASRKAEKGTELHGLSELVDQGQSLPATASFGDVIDMDAYRHATSFLSIRHMERLMVQDDLGVAGTPDRVSSVLPGYELVTPDGDTIGPDELLITDLKTGDFVKVTDRGTTIHGGLKMAMQLALYSRSRLYDPASGERSSIEHLNQKWALIMHVAAGSGVCTLYWVDLTLGWEAVETAGKVRDMRRRGRKALLPAAVAKFNERGNSNVA